MSGELPQHDLSQYKTVITTAVQWGEMDAFGHVNNVVYFRWFESARIKYLDSIGLDHLMQEDRVGPILAHVACNFRRQLKYPDNLRIGARISRIGRSSMTMQHAIHSAAHNALVAEGESTVVVFDYNTQKPCRVPDNIRQQIEAAEGRTFA